jgi:hypothetical protein
MQSQDNSFLILDLCGKSWARQTRHLRAQTLNCLIFRNERFRRTVFQARFSGYLMLYWLDASREFRNTAASTPCSTRFTKKGQAKSVCPFLHFFPPEISYAILVSPS